MDRSVSAAQGGFTLIELLMVTSIIATLAAIAIPIYSNYLVRAKFSEPLIIASQAKLPVAEYFILNGEFPRNNEEAGLAEPAAYAAAYVRRLRISPGGHIVVTLKGDSFSGHWLTLIPTQVNDAVSWECISTLPMSKLPATCRSEP